MGRPLGEFSKWAENGQELTDRLLQLVDADTEAFNEVMAAFRLPSGNESEKAARKQAIQDATLLATTIPLEVMKTSAAAFPLLKEMAVNGNPNSVSDAGVGALAARAAVHGAFLNVKINAPGLDDEAVRNDLVQQATALADEADKMEAEIVAIVDRAL